MAHTQPPPLRPVHPHPPSTTPAPGRTQPAPEHHRPPLQHPRTPPHPPPPVPAPAGQRLRPGRPRRQRPRQIPRRHAAPPDQLLLRHRIEQHLTARASPVFVLHPVRRPPLSGQIRGVQPVRGRHPMHKRPRRLTHHGPHPQDCLHRTASPSPPDQTVPRSTPGAPARRYRCTANERYWCPGSAAAVDERADSPRLPPRWPRHAPATPADGNSGPVARAY
jgi:hypothetical protein